MSNSSYSRLLNHSSALDRKAESLSYLPPRRSRLRSHTRFLTLCGTTLALLISTFPFTLTLNTEAHARRADIPGDSARDSTTFIERHVPKGVIFSAGVCGAPRAWLERLISLAEEMISVTQGHRRRGKEVREHLSLLRELISTDQAALPERIDIVTFIPKSTGKLIITASLNPSFFEKANRFLASINATDEVFISKTGLKIRQLLFPCTFKDQRWYTCELEKVYENRHQVRSDEFEHPRLSPESLAWVMFDSAFASPLLNPSEARPLKATHHYGIAELLWGEGARGVDVKLFGAPRYQLESSVKHPLIHNSHGFMALNLNLKRALDDLVAFLIDIIKLTSSDEARAERETRDINVFKRELSPIIDQLSGHLTLRFAGSLTRPVLSIGVKSAATGLELINTIINHPLLGAPRRPLLRWGAPSFDAVKYIEVGPFLRIPLLFLPDRVVIARYPQDAKSSTEDQTGWTLKAEPSSSLFSAELMNALSPSLISQVFLPRAEVYLKGTWLELFMHTLPLHRFLLRLSSVYVELTQGADHYKLSSRLRMLPSAKSPQDTLATLYDELVREALDFNLVRANELLIKILSAPQASLFTQKARLMLLGPF